MRIKFLKPFTGVLVHNICCFSGSHDSTEKSFAAGDVLEVASVVRGPKVKGGRKSKVYLPSNSLHPDNIDGIPETDFEVIEA